MLNLKIQNLGDVTVFRCAGRITADDADGLRKAVLAQSQLRVAVLERAAALAAVVPRDAAIAAAQRGDLWREQLGAPQEAVAEHDGLDVQRGKALHLPASRGDVIAVERARERDASEPRLDGAALEWEEQLPLAMAV